MRIHTVRSWAVAVASLHLCAHAWAAASHDAPAPSLAEASVCSEAPLLARLIAFTSDATRDAASNMRVASAQHANTQLGLSANLTWNPTISWRGVGDSAWMDADAVSSATLTGGLQWQHDVAAMHRAEIALERAERDLGAAHNRDLRTVIARLVDLDRAHIALSLAQDAASSASLTLQRAEAVDLHASEGTRAAGEGMPADRATLWAAQLASERAAAGVDRANRNLAQAQREAERVGIDTQRVGDHHIARFAAHPLEGWRLTLPAADAFDTPAVRRSLIDLALARTLAERTLTQGFLSNLKLEASHAHHDARMRASLTLDPTRPQAQLDVTLRESNQRPQWTLAVSAQVKLSSDDLRNQAQAQYNLVQAAHAHAALIDESAWLLASARQTALDAEADIAFAERDVALARILLHDATARWRSADKSTTVDRERADAALARTWVSFERARDAFARAWERYLLEAERYWNAAGVRGGLLAPWADDDPRHACYEALVAIR